MKPIIVVVIPLGMCFDREVLKPYDYELFLGNSNIEEQWKRLEELRETGGLIVVQPDAESAMREVLDSYIGEDGYINDCGFKEIHTESHGDFPIVLFHNPSETMIERVFALLNERRKSL